MADLHQDINRVSTCSRSLVIKLCYEGNALLREYLGLLTQMRKASNKTTYLFTSELTYQNLNLAIPLRKCSNQFMHLINAKSPLMSY